MRELRALVVGGVEALMIRAQLARHVKSLSAEGKMSAVVLLALPLVVVLLVSLANPGYLSLLFEDPRGLAMIGLCVVLMTAGSLWLRRLIRPIY